MMAHLFHFLQMGGYGVYVFGAYGSVFTLLLLQWFISWRRLQRHLHTQNKNS